MADEPDPEIYRAAVNSMPAAARLVFRLHGVVGVPIADIAMALGQPADEIEDLLAEAIIHIGEALDAARGKGTNDG